MAGLVRQHLLDLRLGSGQPRARLLEPLDALFEQLQGLVQVELLRLEPPHDLLEAAGLLCEALGLARRGGACHHDSPAPAPTSPSVTRTPHPTPPPNCPPRLTTPPPSSRPSTY